MSALSTLWPRPVGSRDRLAQGVSRRADPMRAASDLASQLDGVDAATVLVFVSPQYDLDSLARALSKSFDGTPVIGCTTAGEITPLGYETGTLTGVAFPKKHWGCPR